MRVLLLGATGPSGILIIHEFFKVYPDGTLIVYARNPAKLSSHITSNPSITIIKGELTDTNSLITAFASTSSQPKIDAVLSTLGPAFGHSSTIPLTRAYGTIIPMMATYGCKRLIALSTISAEDKRDKFRLLAYILVTIVCFIQRNAYNDIVAYSKVIASKGDEHAIDWTLVRVPNLNNKAGQRAVVGYVGDGRTGLGLSRVALAQFYVREIEGNEWVRKAPALSSKVP